LTLIPYWQWLLRYDVEEFSVARLKGHRLCNKAQLSEQHRLDTRTMFHISLTRLAAFLVQERPLDDEEQGHLVRCDQCQQAMGDTGLEELASQKDAKAT
jgi:hypothetical protein